MSTRNSTAFPHRSRLKFYLFNARVTARPGVTWLSAVQNTLRQIARESGTPDDSLTVTGGDLGIGAVTPARDTQDEFQTVSVSAEYTSTVRLTQEESVRALARAFNNSCTVLSATGGSFPFGQGADIVTAFNANTKTYGGVKVDAAGTSLVDLTPARTPARTPPTPVTTTIPSTVTPTSTTTRVPIPATNASPARVAVITTTAPTTNVPATSTVTVVDATTGAVVTPAAPASTEVVPATATAPAAIRVVAETPQVRIRTTTTRAAGAATATTVATTEAKPGWDPSDPGATPTPGMKPGGSSGSTTVAVALGVAAAAGLAYYIATSKKRRVSMRGVYA